ncbi:MAG: hypothetical protein OXE78_01545, partial [Gammaproteobacteria bacterium]|nr:hypothetical protein [Gammaproteobacteria bacterium]
MHYFDLEDPEDFNQLSEPKLALKEGLSITNFRCPDLVYFLSANVMTASSRISSIFRQPVSHVKQDRQSR